MDDDLKVGTCSYCGTKTLITESIPNKIDIQLPEINHQRSEQLTEYSYRMLIQGQKKTAIDSIDEALRLDPDNTAAWVLYSVLTKNPLKPEVMKKLDLEKGLPMATDLLSFDRTLSTMIYPIYPQLNKKMNQTKDEIIKWTEITEGTGLEISFEHRCKKRKDSIVHYHDWIKDDVTLEQGLNTLNLESGIHVFINTITKKYLIIAIPCITYGVPQYFCSPYSSPILESKGNFDFRKWASDLDYMIVNSFIVDKETRKKIIVDCKDMQSNIESLLN